MFFNVFKWAYTFLWKRLSRTFAGWSVHKLCAHDGVRSVLFSFIDIYLLSNKNHYGWHTFTHTLRSILCQRKMESEKNTKYFSKSECFIIQIFISIIRKHFDTFMPFIPMPFNIISFFVEARFLLKRPRPFFVGCLLMLHISNNFVFLFFFICSHYSKRI